MIISRTPLRISFVGGGSDLRAYYQYRRGAVVTTATDKYMYVTVNQRFDDTVRVSYTETEIVDQVDDLQHELVRESTKLSGLHHGLEITTIADVPGGSGLGSSSSLTVGLLNALNAFQGRSHSAEELAAGACKIEIEILNKPIGKQDQYIAAYGGLQFIRFNGDETVFVDPIICKPETKQTLQDRLMMFYTGLQRDSSDILADQQARMVTDQEKHKVLEKMVELAEVMCEDLRDNRLDRFGSLLNENWILKKQLSPHISLPLVDECYEKAMAAGATGGKLLGAGGGGFLLLYCERERQEGVRSAMEAQSLKELKFAFDPQGSKIIYVGG